MTSVPARIGIGVITHNRLPYLERLIDQIRINATLPYDIVIADDGSDDGTPEWARCERIPLVTGTRHGVAWNKNRALLYLAMFSEGDVILLIEDDMWPVAPGWDDAWRRAALTWRHVNYAESTYSDQPGLGALGKGTPGDPFQASLYGGQCTATSREALATVGYLNTRFRGYGYGHAEWSRRYQAHFGAEWGFPDARVPCIDIGLSEAWTSTRAFNEPDASRNFALLAKLAENPCPDRFTPPWSDPAERQELLMEVVTGQQLAANPPEPILAPLRPEPPVQPHNQKAPPHPAAFHLYTDQLIAFRHYLHGVFHLRPLVPVRSAHLKIDGAMIDLSPSYSRDHVMLEGFGLIKGIQGVEDAKIHVSTAAGEFSCGDLVTKDLHRIDPFSRTLGEFVTHVNSSRLDVLEIGSRRRIATAYDPGFRDKARSYTGIDILDGPNVDIVCDAHRLSHHVEPSSFDIVYSQYVFEHLAMPWVAATEINRVLRIDGECFIATNQSIGLHDLPWDFWRFSESAWHALFNEDTGFELLTSGLGEPVHITPRRYHPGFRDHEGGVGYQASFAWARKIRDIHPNWPVSSERIFAKLSRAYPREITD